MSQAHAQKAPPKPKDWKHQPESLQGKRVLVTGGTTGIGRTTALLLAGTSIDAASEDGGQTYEQFRYIVETNLLGYMDCARQAAKRMTPDKRGHIVNVGSMSAESKSAGSDVYVATKSAIRGFSRALGKRLARHHIHVSLIEPGLTGADLFEDEKSDPAHQRQLQAKYQMMTSEDIAEAILYMLVQPLRCNVVGIQVHQLLPSD